MTTLLFGCGSGTTPERADAGEPDAIEPEEPEAAADAGPGTVDVCGGCAIGLACDEPTARCAQQATAFVTTRDGLRLWTHVMLPDEVPAAGVPTVLTRTPYRHVYGVDEAFGELMNARGYAYVQQDCRGQSGSDGTFLPFANEVEDGQDTTAWIVAQAWANGRLGTIGGSYDGYTAVAASIDNPDVDVVIADDAAEDVGFERLGGAASTHLLSWLHLLDTGDWMSTELQVEATNALEVGALDERVLGQPHPLYQAWLDSEDPAFPADGSLKNRYEGTCAPLLSILSGDPVGFWWDPVRIWQGFAERGCPEHREDARLVLTQESHCYHLGVIASLETPVTRLMLATLDRWLRDDVQAGVDDRPAIAALPRGGEALEPVAGWTGENTETLYLGEATLDAQPPQESATPEILRVDPETMDPCESDQYPYLAYLGEPLEAPLEIRGSIVANLFVSSTAPDADVFVGVGTLDDRGAWDETFAVGILRLRYRGGRQAPAAMVPDEIDLVQVPMPPVTRRIPAGHQLVVFVTLGGCGYLENPHTGAPLAEQHERRDVTVRIEHDPEHPSRVEIPTGSRAD